MKRWLGGIGVLVGFGIALYGAFVLGEFSGRAKEIQRYARADAKRVAALMVSGEIDLLQRLKLLTVEGAESLREASRKNGPATKVVIRDVSAGPFGLPVPIDLEVTRRGTVRQEGLVRHSLSTTFEHWMGE